MLSNTHLHSFTPRGIVALVFSCVTGVLGVIVVAWYGLSTPLELIPMEVSRVIDHSEAPESTNAAAAAPAAGEFKGTVSTSNDATGGVISKS